MTTEERLEAVWQLSLESWALAGKTLPDYDRSNMPVRISRPVRYRKGSL